MSNYQDEETAHFVLLGESIIEEWMDEDSGLALLFSGLEEWCISVGVSGGAVLEAIVGGFLHEQVVWPRSAIEKAVPGSSLMIRLARASA
ncbi:MAG: hypothetical protein JWO22_1253 [Frankiales bacterium]|nr:hypothetical protein [Frankiales bacterium]